MTNTHFRSAGLLFAGAVCLGLGACMAPGPERDITITMPDANGKAGAGQVATIVAYEKYWPDWMYDTSKMKLEYIVPGKPTDVERKAVEAAEQACRTYTKTVRPNEFAAIFFDGVLYSGAGFAGGGLGSVAFPNAIFRQYAAYTAGATGVAGAANGIISVGGKSYTFQSCGDKVFGMFPYYGVRPMEDSPNY